MTMLTLSSAALLARPLRRHSSESQFAGVMWSRLRSSSIPSSVVCESVTQYACICREVCIWSSSTSAIAERIASLAYGSKRVISATLWGTIIGPKRCHLSMPRASGALFSFTRCWCHAPIWGGSTRMITLSTKTRFQKG
jgi:hypothetical protein